MKKKLVRNFFKTCKLRLFGLQKLSKGAMV